MDPYIKDIIDSVSQIAGVCGLFVAIFLAWHEFTKTREEKINELQKDREQKERELNYIRLTRETNEARFWLELRKIFSEHKEVHLNFRPNGQWYKSDTNPTAEEMPLVEDYMGLFEHCKIMLDKELINWNTFEHIYAYRVKNILKNPVVVREKLIMRFGGWKDFIQLVRILRFQQLMIETGGSWLISRDGKSWLNTQHGKKWLATEEGERWMNTED